MIPGAAPEAPGDRAGDRAKIRYVAIGDSFTEGVGDELPDGTVRGWADLVAQGIADATGEPIQYANLAIRGRLLGRILSEQVEPAVALAPTLVTFNGGGNDMLRPGTNLSWIAGETERALRRLQSAGAEPVLLAGANPTASIPRGSRVSVKGDELVVAASAIAERLGIRFVNNWGDPVLGARQYWSQDRLHLAPVGHRRVAANVLRALDFDVPADWEVTAAAIPSPTRREQLAYMREHVVPWVGRRLTGRSSGDGRAPKFAAWTWVHPRDRPLANDSA